MNSFNKGVIGKKFPSDTTLNNMKKTDLIELLHTAQHNYETLNWFYNNAVNANMSNIKEFKEIRIKIIDEFINKLKQELKDNTDHLEYGITWGDIEQVANEMKVEMDKELDTE